MNSLHYCSQPWDYCTVPPAWVKRVCHPVINVHNIEWAKIFIFSILLSRILSNFTGMTMSCSFLSINTRTSVECWWLTNEQVKIIIVYSVPTPKHEPGLEGDHYDLGQQNLCAVIPSNAPGVKQRKIYTGSILFIP